ncbi:MAG: hypothetical protein GXO32_04975 [Crenarchaeota archaeon]|nr:hypothetical protein [Thermoproteota archaeon]
MGSQLCENRFIATYLERVMGMSERRLEKLLEYARYLESRVKVYVDVLKFLLTLVIASPIAAIALRNLYAAIGFLIALAVAMAAVAMLGRAISGIRREEETVWGEILADPRKLPGLELVAKVVILVGIGSAITIALYIASLLLG